MALDQHQPDVIINAAAYTAVDKAESDVATRLPINHLPPRMLVAATSRTTSAFTCCKFPPILCLTGCNPPLTCRKAPPTR